jgi:hypothetical protein
VLQRLDRLTLDEARITAAQTLEVVYGLFQYMKVVMDGEQIHQFCRTLGVEPGSLPLDGKASVDHLRDILSMFSRPQLSDFVSDIA